MWVNRTSEEIAKSYWNAKIDALTHGLLIGIAAWVVSTAMLASGWLISPTLGIAVEQGAGGDFWKRIPMCAFGTLPFAIFAFWYERRKALKRIISQTICIQCDSIGSNNASSICSCGGIFVESNSMKWVETSGVKNG